MDFANAENINTTGSSTADMQSAFRSYVQRRRVSTESSAAEQEAKEEPEQETAGTSASDSAGESFSSAKTWAWSDSQEKTSDGYEFDRSQSASQGRATALRRTDTDFYQKLYGHGPKRQPQYANPYQAQPAGQPAVEDNRAARLSIKLIKQSVACFAIIGLVVLMQSRADMQSILAFVKKHLIETNVDPNNILEGIKSAVNQCARLLGGSP